jgi:hypothetical protein
MPKFLTIKRFMIVLVPCNTRPVKIRLMPSIDSHAAVNPGPTVKSSDAPVNSLNLFKALIPMAEPRVKRPAPGKPNARNGFF